ncbi:hypothetical protein ACFXJ5_09120 [Streptomyces sp. NPDC059373]
MFILTAPDGGDWGMTLDSFADALRERNPDEFIKVWEDEPGPGPSSPSLSFGITLGDEDFEGIALTAPQGASVKDCTAAHAAEFAQWLRERIVPASAEITFNTEAGMEWELPDVTLPNAPAEELRDVFLSHLAEVEEEDERHTR